MSLPRVVAVTPESPAARAGLLVGDELLALNGQAPRDVIEYRLLADGAELELDVRRGGLDVTVGLTKEDGEPLGVEVQSALFDRVQTCDNHCEFCFIYQLPKGMRPSLYLKDDDYRLSFLYGNFTTLTRFTEADLERVVSERLSPLFVSIHATDPDVRARMLRNRRGATSLRWLRQLLDHEIEVHGQVVVCPGLNDGAVLNDTLAGVLDEYPELSTVCAVPLGISRHSGEQSLRPHTREDAGTTVDVVERWQDVFLGSLGRRMVYAADEYYLLAGRPFPDATAYDGFPQHENGVGMARAFELELTGRATEVHGVHAGFFSWVDGAPAEGYRAPRTAAATAAATPVQLRRSSPRQRVGRDAPITVLTGEYGAQVLAPLLALIGRNDVRILPVRNDFFGGNIAVTGLMVGADVARVLSEQRDGNGHRYLLPDVCLSNGRFLDGLAVDDLPRAVEVVATDGAALRRALSAPAAA